MVVTSGSVVHLKVICNEVGTASEPKIELRLKYGDTEKDFSLPFRYDKWLNSKMAALSMMLEAVIHKRGLTVSSKDTGEILYVQLEQGF